ncbi:ankyrin repeat domain-containing protein [Alkalilimnicola ehrlichii]|nr:ankyrin repeat domain-containing protein [Alkalilimnicola ehrlichii]
MNIFLIVVSAGALFYTLRRYRKQQHLHRTNRWKKVRDLAWIGALVGCIGFLITGELIALLGAFLFVVLGVGAAHLAQRQDEEVLRAAQAEAEALAASMPGVPPLVVATKRRDYLKMGMLIAAGADLDAWGPDGLNPFAICARQADLQGLRTLLLGDANPDQPVRDGLTALMEAAREDLAAMARILLDAGADPDRGGPRGETALGMAAQEGAFEVAKLLLERGAAPNLPSRDGYMPLMRAADGGHHRVVELLLARGAEVDYKVGEGEVSALMLAVEGGHDQVVELLLKAAETQQVQFTRVPELIDMAEEKGFLAIADQLRLIPEELLYSAPEEEEEMPLEMMNGQGLPKV